jgi:hypothetical protein
MTRQVAKFLASRLFGIQVMDKIGGVVQVAEKAIQGDELGSTRIMKFPVSDQFHVRDGVNCATGAVIDFIPDSKLRSMAYFEDQGSTIDKMRGLTLFMKSRLRLVCWFNPVLIDKDYATRETDPSAIFQAAVLTWLTSMQHERGQVLGDICVRVVRILSQDASIFSQYTYNNAQSQYLLLPYQYFAFDIEVTYRAASDAGCLEQLIQGEAGC